MDRSDPTIKESSLWLIYQGWNSTFAVVYSTIYLIFSLVELFLCLTRKTNLFFVVVGIMIAKVFCGVIAIIYWGVLLDVAFLYFCRLVLKSPPADHDNNLRDCVFDFQNGKPADCSYFESHTSPRDMYFYGIPQAR